MNESMIPWLLVAILLLLAPQTYEAIRSRFATSNRQRVPLPMSSATKVPPNASAQVTANPIQGHFRPERLIISQPEDWIVNDIKINGISQFSQSGDVPGEMFAATAMYCWIRFDEVPQGGQLQIVVTYIGSQPEGAPFVAGILGSQRKARLRRPRPSRFCEPTPDGILT